MKTKILFGILLAVLASSSAGFTHEKGAGTGVKSKLIFEVEPVKAVYVKGEDVELIFRLSNRSGDRVLVAKTFQLTHFVTLDIVNSEGKRAKWCGRIAGQTDFPRSFIVLSPGESVSKKLVVSCINKDDHSRAWGYSLDRPGKYIVTGTYSLPQPQSFFKKLSPNVPAVRGPIVAQPITIEIR